MTQYNLLTIRSGLLFWSTQ